MNYIVMNSSDIPTPTRKAHEYQLKVELKYVKCSLFVKELEGVVAYSAARDRALP